LRVFRLIGLTCKAPGLLILVLSRRCCTDRLRLPAKARSAQAGTPQTTGHPAVPFKHHAKHHHHIPKPRYRVTNGPEYDAALRRRGSLTVWFTDEAIAAWRAEPRTTPGGQPHYSALAIMTALTMRAVFGLALRQTEGLIGSVIALLGLDLTVPDHSTLSRRSKTLEMPPLRWSGTGPLHLLVDSTGLKLGGAGEWLVEKHGTSRRRSWRKLHLGVDAESGEIVAIELTKKEIDDAARSGALLDQITDPIASFTADSDRVARIGHANAVTPTSPGFMRSGHSLGVQTQASGSRQRQRQRWRLPWPRSRQYAIVAHRRSRVCIDQLRPRP
jgi:hypothetical protein